MAYEEKDLSGVLFKNDRKTEDKHPHMKGHCLIGGKKYWISAWTKPGKNGDRFQSLAFTLAQEQAPAVATSGSATPPEDDIPW